MSKLRFINCFLKLLLFECDFSIEISLSSWFTLQVRCKFEGALIILDISFIEIEISVGYSNTLANSEVQNNFISLSM